MLSKAKLLQKLIDSGIIVVISGIPQDKIIQVADRLVNEGFTALEVTIDTPSSFSTINKLSNLLRDRAIIGAGTVIDNDAAQLAIESGADFILIPGLHQDVIETTLNHGKIAIAEVLTAIEIITAIEWGVDFVNVIQSTNEGYKYIRGIKDPPIIPTLEFQLDKVVS